MKTYIIQNKGKGLLNVQPDDLVKISETTNSTLQQVTENGNTTDQEIFHNGNFHTKSINLFDSPFGNKYGYSQLFLNGDDTGEEGALYYYKATQSGKDGYFMPLTVNGVSANSQGNIQISVDGFIPLSGTSAQTGNVTGSITSEANSAFVNSTNGVGIIFNGEYSGFGSKNRDRNLIGDFNTIQNIRKNNDAYGIYTGSQDGYGSYYIYSKEGITIDHSIPTNPELSFEPYGIHGLTDYSLVQPTNKLIYTQRSYVDHAIEYALSQYPDPDLQQVLTKGGITANTEIDLSRNLTTAGYLISAYSDNATTAKWGQFVVYQEADGYLNVYSALRSTNPATPSISTYYGWQALQSFPRSATTTSTRLTAFGYRAGRQLTAGNNNNFIGGAAGTNIVAGSGNTIVGSYNFPANTTLNNSVVISDGTNTRIVFQTSDTGLTTIPQQTTTNYAVDATGKAVVTKEILNASFTRNLDMEITDATKGIILKAPNGTRFRVTIGNSGALSATAI